MPLLTFDVMSDDIANVLNKLSEELVSDVHQLICDELGVPAQACKSRVHSYSKMKTGRSPNYFIGSIDDMDPITGSPHQCILLTVEILTGRSAAQKKQLGEKLHQLLCTTFEAEQHPLLQIRCHIKEIEQDFYFGA